ncbi:hypothetical protein CAPTEDRAFT_223135 [Capitella teleta]|uniref:BZIP domain-containing protein n=1 Tax=Capitella teleta TaxID=283909 RepID=R7V953_CAPTE|nr:hypothetical protein CAPTEDRAFT_223135 [Capitella teleta]|eukprot:ELU12891.1 hypothetical protein CAPTEDRAFT_223135 [Capitella teleta]
MSLTNDLSLYDGLWEDFPGVPDNFGEIEDGGESVESGSTGSGDPIDEDSPGVLFPDLDGISSGQKKLHRLIPKRELQPKKALTIRVRNPDGKMVRVTKDDLLSLKPMMTGHESDGSAETANDFCMNGGKSMSKNAILARENRQRRKMYVSNLETSVKKLTSENRALKDNLKESEGSVASLQKELAYLKAVLANQSTLSSLLQNITETPGVNFKSSCAPKPAKSDNTVEMKRKAVIAANRRLIEKENEEEESAGKWPKVADHDYAVPNPSGAEVPFAVIEQ